MCYVKITIKYCSEEFDEVIGTSEDGKKVAAFVIPGYFKVTYPIKSDTIFVTPECVFEIPSLNYNIIPFMRYGALALYIESLFPSHNFILYQTGKAIEKVITSMISYKQPAATNTIANTITNTITIDYHQMTINKDIYNFTSKSIFSLVSRDLIVRAIQKTTQTNCIIIDLKKQSVAQHKPRAFFFTIYEL